MTKNTLETGFWKYVKKKDSCWVWIGSRYSNGYGRCSVDGKRVSAHRFSYELHKGEIPNNYVVMHSCDNVRCVNPEHLSVGTQKDNIQDCKAKGRVNNTVSGRLRRALSDEQVREMRASPDKYRLFSAKFGIPVAAIRRCIDKITYKDVF
jgi:hypothetical protein